MKVGIDSRVEKILSSFSSTERARVERVINLFEEKEFLLNEPYLKKLMKGLWELRPGNIRLLFGIVGKNAVIVNTFRKKTQKTPPKEIRLAQKRLGEYL